MTPEPKSPDPETLKGLDRVRALLTERVEAARGRLELVPRGRGLADHLAAAEADLAAFDAVARPSPSPGEHEALIADLRAPSHKQDSKWHTPKAIYATVPRELLNAAADALARTPGSMEGEATWRALDNNGLAELRVNGQRITSFPSYSAAEEAAERINRALAKTTPPASGAAGDGAEYQKTATIRAIQYLGQHVAGVCTGGPPCKSKGAPDDCVPHIHTLEGDLTVSHGDWIATGFKGEHWAIKPDIFAASYVPVLAKPAPPPGVVEGRDKAFADLIKVAKRLRSRDLPAKDAAPMIEGYVGRLQALAALSTPQPEPEGK
jgi:hypothetical protein